MGIKIKKPAKIRATREFTDRLEPRKAFWNRYAKMVNDNSTLITFYGAGGVGKSALLKKLMSEIDQKRSMMQEDIAYVHYDFDNNCDVRTIIKILKTQLEKYGCIFPLFETGNFYYELKMGNKDMSSPEIHSIMDKSPYLQEIKKNWDNVGTIADFMVPGIRAVTTFMDILDKGLVKFLKNHDMFDGDHEDLKYKLGAMRMSTNPNELYEFLPTLFAQDVADWLTDERSDKQRTLVVFLDTYEVLVNEAVAVKTQRNRDLWLRDKNNGIINFIPNTLWVISGRNKIRWTGDLNEELDQHLITALSDVDSDYFLKQAGIENAELRDGIIKLTQGFPIYLDLCVDVYERYKQRNGTEPDILEFGEHQQEVLDRLIKYMDANNQDMIYFLSILNTWTDDMAKEIGYKSLPNFSVAFYNQTRYFSFIQREKVHLDDLDIINFTFDKTVQGIIFSGCDEFIIKKIKDSANIYFKNMLEFSTVNEIFNYYLNLWIKLIIRITDEPKDLYRQYEDNIRVCIDKLVNNMNFSTSESIIQQFLDKILNTEKADSLTCAFFEYEYSKVKLKCGHFKDVLNHIEFAYQKFDELLDTHDPKKLSAMYILSVIYRRLGQYDNALDINKKLIDIYKNTENVDIQDNIDAINNLTSILNSLKRYDESLKLREEVLEFCKNRCDTGDLRIATAMHKLANSLDYLGQHDKALELRNQVLSLRNKKLGERHPDTIWAMNNKANTLNYLNQHEQALELNRQAFDLDKDIFGINHPNTLWAMTKLANTLNHMGKIEEARKIIKEAMVISKEVLPKKYSLALEISKLYEQIWASKKYIEQLQEL